MSRRAPRRVRFVRADLKNVTSDRCDVEVELKRGDQPCVGRAEGGCLLAGKLRSAAEATADALSQLGAPVKVDRLEIVQVFGDLAVAVRVAAAHEDETRTLVGFCLLGPDPLKATGLAVLNATGRFLEIA